MTSNQETGKPTMTCNEIKEKQNAEVKLWSADVQSRYSGIKSQFQQVDKNLWRIGGSAPWCARWGTYPGGDGALCQFVDPPGGPFVATGTRLSEFIPLLPKEHDGIITKIVMGEQRCSALLHTSPL